MADGGSCVFCGTLLSAGAVTEVKKKGLEKIKKCSERRNDGKDVLLQGLESLEVHINCWKKYTNEKNVSVAERNASRPNAVPINVAGDAVPEVPGVAFSFGDHCFFCGDEISEAFKESEKKKSVEKRIVVSTVTSQHTRNSIVNAAEKYPNDWSTEVLHRIEGVDLVARNAQYHRPCYSRFCTASRGGSSDKLGRPISDDVASKMDLIFQYIDENKDQCQFNMAELKKVVDNPPSTPTIKDRLQKKYKENVVIHERVGHPLVISIRNHQELLDSWYHNKLPDSERERARVVETAGAILLEDIQTALYDTTEYPSPDKFLDSAENDVPKSLRLLLNKIVLANKSHSTDVYQKQCIAIGHYIVAASRPRTFASCLQIGLSAYLHSKFGSKNLIQVLSTLGCCVSYSETETLELSTVLHPEDDSPKGFLQFVADNADVNIGTLNGRGTFHSMGMIQCVTPKPIANLSRKIVRVTGTYGRQIIKNTPQIPIQTFVRSRAEEKGLKTVTVEMVEDNDSIRLRVADLLFMYAKLKDIPRVPGWNGFMEKLTCRESYAVSNIVALPFINASPSDYNTIYTTLLTAAERAQKANQKACLVTFDQPLFQKARDIVASSTNILLKPVIVRLGGMHLLMSFMGCIGYIMAGSGLKEVLSLIYAPVSVDKMLTGHAYARALRGHSLTQLALGHIILTKLDFSADEEMEIEDLLEHFDSGTAKQRMEDKMFEEICQRFENQSQVLEAQGPTAALWMQYFRMVTLVKQFIEAERSGNWQLHLSTIAKMLPFFHAAGHNNYALSAHLYLQDMQDLEQKMGFHEFHEFISKGYFTIRRSDKFWSGIWSDMTIEQTLMRSMKANGGVTRGRGVTDSVLTKWILGIPVMLKLSESIENFVGIKSTSSEQHVDARPTRQKRDNADVQELLRWFEIHNPFPVSDNIVSLSTGVVGGDEINCHKALVIGMEGLKAMVGKNFVEISFSRKKRVLPLSVVTSSLKIADKVVPVDPLLLFQRIAFTKESQDQFQSFFAYELAPYPLSLFDEIGMRKSTKSAFYKLFTPITYDVTSGEVRYVVDGGHLLHKVVWRKGDAYGEICNKYINYIRTHYGGHVTVVFDGYPESDTEKSTKTAERLRRMKTLSVDVFIEESMPSTTSQDKFLSNDKNKARLISLLMSKLRRAEYEAIQSTEDADTLIVSTAVDLSLDYANVIIVGEDIDLLLLLIGTDDRSRNNVYFMKPGKGKSSTFVYSSDSLKNQSLKPYVLTCHAFTGCDTTSALFNQGKMKLTSLVLKHDDICTALDCFKVANADPVVIADAGEKILCRMYDKKSPKSLDVLRYEGFARSMTKSKFNIAGLPPTKAAATQHSYRVYHQVQQWMGRTQPATSWGWKRDPNGLTPVLTTLEPAPDELLKLISCKCEKGCGRSCGCRKAGLKCSEICYSCHGRTCTNVKTFELDELDEENELDVVQKDLLNQDTDQFGEPQDLSAEDCEMEPVEEAMIDEPHDDEPLDDSSSPKPSTSKRRRISYHDEVIDDDSNNEAM